MVAFKAVSYGLVGLLALTVLILSVGSLRREIIAGNPLNGCFASFYLLPRSALLSGCLALTSKFHQATSILLQSGTAGISSQQ
jgi:hypothetical protein